MIENNIKVIFKKLFKNIKKNKLKTLQMPTKYRRIVLKNNHQKLFLKPLPK